MEDVKPKRLKWVLFGVGALALSTIPFFLAFSHVVRGPAILVAMLVWIFVYMAYVYVGSARLKADRIGPVMKRYRRRLAVAMVAYSLILIGSLSLLRGAKLTGPLLWIVAAAPAIPILGVLVVMGLYLKEEPDELDRAVHVEAMLWGLGAVLAVTTVWGFLSNAGVIPQPPLFLVFPLFCLSWGVSQPLIRRRYQ
jgi:phosphatidylglycerophosphate synthase